jgi:hypothetical protein
MKLGATGQKWLKIVHLFFVCIWVGPGVTLVAMQFAMSPGPNGTGGMLHGIDTSMKFVDDWLIIPGAFGCLITGLLYSLLTNWGFFRHGWITLKWTITVGGILFGTFFLGPWLNALAPASLELGLDALHNPAYLHNKTMNSIWGPVQVGTLVFAVAISVLKPWKAKPRKA